MARLSRLSSLAAFALAPLALALGGCADEDDGPDLTGVWRVTLHTQNPSGCSVGPQVTDPPFIKFAREELFGQKYFVYVHCSDAGVTCEPSSGIFGNAYSIPITDGHRSESYGTADLGTECILSGTISTALVGRDGALTIETRRSSQTVTGVECTADEARARLEAGTLPCVELETLAAVRN